MSRPRRSEHTREALIEAGIEQISSYGYHGTGIKQILDKVKVPKGSFYNFFASKEAFVAEVIEAYSCDLLHKLNQFTDGEGKALTARQQLTAIINFSVDKIADSNFQHSCLIGSLSSEMGAESDECRQQLQKAAQRWILFLTGVIKRGQQEGNIRADLSADELANLYWATWEGAMIKLHLYKEVKQTKQVMELMLNRLMVSN